MSVSFSSGQQLDVVGEPAHPGSSLSLRVQATQGNTSAVTSSTLRHMGNSEAGNDLNANVMSQSATSQQSRVQRSVSATNSQKPSEISTNCNSSLHLSFFVSFDSSFVVVICGTVLCRCAVNIVQTNKQYSCTFFISSAINWKVVNHFFSTCFWVCNVKLCIFLS